MSKDEALKLALEALQLVSIEFVCNGAHHAKKDRHDWLESCPVVERYQAAITAIREALAQPDYRAVKTYHEGKPVYVSQDEQSSSQEPVAWEQFYPDIGKPQLGQEPVAFSCLRCATPKKCAVHGCSPNTWPSESSPKRPWVGLTDDERANCWRSSAKQTAINIEATLKEKNT